eukprot:7173886-Alexandrium_andersonii.AAC.1
MGRASALRARLADCVQLALVAGRTTLRRRWSCPQLCRRFRYGSCWLAFVHKATCNGSVLSWARMAATGCVTSGP